MKRGTAFFLALILLLSFSGCSIWQGSSADVAPITVHTGGGDTTPYVNFLWAQSYGENGWIAADGTRISWNLSQLCNEFPEITYGNDFQIRYQDGVTFQHLSVYNAELQCIHQNVTQDVLKTLPDGTYYLVINVNVQGKYIAAEKQHETSGYECAYKLQVSGSNPQNK